MAHEEAIVQNEEICCAAGRTGTLTVLQPDGTVKLYATSEHVNGCSLPDPDPARVWTMMEDRTELDVSANCSGYSAYER